MALPLAFAVGAGYLLWLAHSLYVLRKQRKRFYLEITILGATFVVALVVLVMGLSLATLDERVFFSLYTCAIGSAFIVVNLVINLSPRLPSNIAGRTIYSQFTSRSFLEHPAAWKGKPS